MCAVTKPSSSALTPLTLSARSLQLTGEASHMDWKRDWEVLSQSCGDQGEGKWRTHARRQSAASLSTHLVLSLRIISCLWHTPISGALPWCASSRWPPSYASEAVCHCRWYLAVSFYCRRGVSLRAAPLPTTLPFWCPCPAMPTHPSSRPARAAPSGCLKRAQCSGISSLSLLVSNAKSLTGFCYLCVLTGGFMLICVFAL